MMKELEPGQRFRGLLVHSVLGRGPAIATYLASHPVLEIPLIIKTFAAQDAELFINARLLAQVGDPAVVPVLDAGLDEETAFVVLRHVDGIDLEELMAHLLPVTRVLPMHLLIPLIAEVARGMHATHLAGGTHGDIGPSQIFLSGSGQGLLTNFGLSSRVQKNGAESPPLTGDPLYRAPEIWQGESPDVRADIYSLGATAHFLATGVPPFQGTDEDLRKAHVEQAYQAPPSEWPESAYFFTLLSAMLAKSPRDRPQSADEVATLLSRITPDAPILRVDSDTTAEICGIYIELYRGDISLAEADVIVNPASSQLSMQSGVAEGLRRAGGDDIEKAAMAQGPASMGDIVWTTAGQLHGTWVAHAVAASAGAVGIQRCTMRVLLEAQARGARSVVFPALGTDEGKVPMPVVARQMLDAILTFCRLGPTAIEQVAVALQDDDALADWSQVLGELGDRQ